MVLIMMKAQGMRHVWKGLSRQNPGGWCSDRWADTPQRRTVSLVGPGAPHQLVSSQARQRE